MKSWWKVIHFHPGKCVWKCPLDNGGRFGSASCMYIHTHIRTFIHTYIHTHIHICWFNFDALAQGIAYKPTKEPINYRGPGGDTHIHTYVRTYINLCIHVYTCIYIHIHIHIHIHIKWYMYIYISICDICKYIWIEFSKSERDISPFFEKRNPLTKTPIVIFFWRV